MHMDKLCMLPPECHTCLTNMFCACLPLLSLSHAAHTIVLYACTCIPYHTTMTPACSYLHACVYYYMCETLQEIDLHSTPQHIAAHPSPP